MIYLYQFLEGYGGESGGEYTNLTSSDDIYYYGDIDAEFVPAVMKMTEIESRSELNKSNLDITFELGHALARRWMTERIYIPRTVTVFEVDEDDNVEVAWKGRLTAVKPSGVEIVLTFESVFTSMRRPGLRSRMLRTCRHSLYGQGCFLSRSTFSEELTMTAIDGAVITVPDAAMFPDGWFTGGMIETFYEGGSLHFITQHIGDQITLVRATQILSRALDDGEDDVFLYPGCDRTRATCQGKFDNLDRYGGFDWIPLRNPFNGSSIV